MGLFSPAIEPGDWIRTTDRVLVTLTDHLLAGGGIPAGTRGVVVGRTGSHVDVELDVGWGTQRTTISARRCRLVRRGGGVARFRQRTSTMTWARVGVALMFAWPFLWYIATYVWTYHSTRGLESGLVIGFLDGLGDFLVGALSNPVRTVVYCVVLAGLSRFAFRRRC